MRYKARGNDGDACVIRQLGEMYVAKKCVTTYKFGCGSVLIWSCFWGKEFGPLVIVEETVSQYVYVHILGKHLHPWFI
jgi:hypothetical protein